MSASARAAVSVTPLKSRRPLIVGPGEIGWFDVELPSEPPAGSVRLRTRVTMISPGTELRLFRGEPMVAEVWEAFARLEPVTMRVPDPQYRVTSPNSPGGPLFPATFGYNNVAEVVQISAGVEQLAVGDRVLNLSRHQQLFDLPVWEAVKIPADVTDEAAAFAYIATLGLHALRQASFRPGENVAIIGLGVVGLSAALVADALGARVVCTDIDPDRLRLAAAALPDTPVLNAGDDDFTTRLEQLLEPHGIDVVLEAAGGRQALDLGLRLLDSNGRLVAVALHPEDIGPLLSSDFYTKQAAILGTSNDPYQDPRARQSRFTIPANCSYLLDLQRRNRISLEKLRTHSYPADNIGDAFAEFATGRKDMIGVLLDWR